MGNFAVGPALCIKITSYVWPNGKFLIFLFQFGLMAIKAMAFWEISPLALLHALNCVSCMVKCEISNISLPLFWCDGCQSHGILGNFTVLPPKSAIFQTCQNKFINFIHHHMVYTLAIITWVLY